MAVRYPKINYVEEVMREGMQIEDANIPVEAKADQEAIAAIRKLKPSADRCEVCLKNRLIASLNDQGVLELTPPE